MSAEYEEIRETFDVPPNTGVAGFLRTLEGVLKLPRVQDIRIDKHGKVEVRYFLREGEQKKSLDLDLETLLPYAVIRNSTVLEFPVGDADALLYLSELYDRVESDGLFPVAFVGGAVSTFWAWYLAKALEIHTRSALYGIPFLKDRALEDNVVVLCAAYTRGAALIDTQQSYKFLVPKVPA